MPLRNGDHGYGAVTKLLHWATVAALVGQFGIGWTMDIDEGLDAEDDRLDAEADRLEDRAEGQGEAAEERAEAEAEAREDALDAREDDVASDVVSGNASGDGISLPEVHVALGLLIIVLAVVRMLWRRSTPLPPWAEHLSGAERRLEALLEKLLLALLVVVPATGLLLMQAGDDWLPLHVTAQIAFLVTIAVHVGLVLRHTVLKRNRHVARML